MTNYTKFFTSILIRTEDSNAPPKRLSLNIIITSGYININFIHSLSCLCHKSINKIPFWARQDSKKIISPFQLKKIVQIKFLFLRMDIMKGTSNFNDKPSFDIQNLLYDNNAYSSAFTGSSAAAWNKKIESSPNHSTIIIKSIK